MFVEFSSAMKGLAVRKLWALLLKITENEKIPKFTYK